MLKLIDKFVIAYFDEAQFRVRMYETHAWAKPRVRGDAIDRWQSTGKGYSFRVSAFLCYSNGDCEVFRDHQGFVGSIHSTIKQKGKAAVNDTADSFLAVMRQ